MSVEVNGIIDWLKGWFFDKDTITSKEQALQSQINNKADSTTVSSLTTTVNSKANKTGGVAQVTDSNASNYTNIGTLSSGATQQAINNAINTRIGELSSFKAINPVSNLPSASTDTTGQLYLISENGKVNAYYTVENNGVYSWHEFDSDILDELSVDWSDITNKVLASMRNDGLMSSDLFLKLVQQRITVMNAGSNNFCHDPYYTTNSSSVTQLYLVIPHTSRIGTNTDIRFNIGSDTSHYTAHYPLIYNPATLTYSFAKYSHIANNQTPLLILSMPDKTYLLNYPFMGNYALKTELTSKLDVGDAVTSIELIPKSQDDTGAIRLYYSDES